MSSLGIENEMENVGLRRGVITLVVLLCLRRENHGYAVRSTLEKKGLSLKEGTLYPLLRRLESQKLLSSRWDAQGSRLRKYYSLTSTGVESLLRLQVQWGQLNDVIKMIMVDDKITEVLS